MVVFAEKCWIDQILEQHINCDCPFGPGTAVVGTGMVAAALSSVMNNPPSVMIAAIVIRDPGIPSLYSFMAYANIVGCDLGTKITPIGSLATLLRLYILDRRGMHLSWQYCVKVGFVLTTPC